MPTTAVFAAQEALTALLAAALADLQPRCHVDLGVPEGGPRDPWHVWVPGRVDEWRRRYDLSGQTSVEEDFVLEVHVLATAGPDRTYGDRNARLVTLIDRTAAAVGSDPRLGGAVRLAHVRSSSIDESLTPETRFLAAVTEVACEANVCT